MLRGLTPQGLLEVCEWAETEPPASRSLALLYVASTDASWEDLAALTIGQRDALLLQLREQTFGQEMQSFSYCQHCGEQLEFSVSTRDLHVGETDYTTEYKFEYEGKTYIFRLPDSNDVLAVANINNEEQAALELAHRCLLDLPIDSKKEIRREISPGLVAALADQISQSDPQAEILIDLQCPACTHEIQSLFDIGEYIWLEFMELSKRLMEQVHWLARGYGWQEVDILRMSAWRRRYYMDLLGV